MAITLRDFNKEDWYGNAGAEHTADGRSPKIGWFDDYNEVLVDANGIELRLYEIDNSLCVPTRMNVWQLDNSNFDMSAFIASNLSDFSAKALEALGFTFNDAFDL
jgi:hypothetical protein